MIKTVFTHVNWFEIHCIAVALGFIIQIDCRVATLNNGFSHDIFRKLADDGIQRRSTTQFNFIYCRTRKKVILWHSFFGGISGFNIPCKAQNGNISHCMMHMRTIPYTDAFELAVWFTIMLPKISFDFVDRAIEITFSWMSNAFKSKSYTKCSFRMFANNA